MIKLVVFDIDGTFVESDDAQVRALRNVFTSFGFKPPEEQAIVKHLALDDHDFIAAVLKEIGHKETEEKIAEMEDYFRKKYFGFYFPVMVHLKAGAREAMEAVRAKGIKTAIATNGVRAYIERVVSFFKISDLFDGSIAADELKHVKPAADPLLKLMQQFNVAPEEVLYLGDTKIDVDTAKNAGTHFALVLCKRNKHIKAEHRLSSLAELPKLVEKFK